MAKHRTAQIRDSILRKIFWNDCSGPEDYRFAKTRIPLRLAELGDEALISRSQARRVLARIDTFDEVLLDFAGVRLIGQGFADEIFRVFANAHPNIKLATANANQQVTEMIKRASASRRS